jgi:hypothetical protein
MPLWDEFLGILKGAADVLTAPLRGAVGGVATTGAKLGGPSVFKGNPELAAQAGLAAESGTRKSLKDAGLLTYDQATAKVVDPVLYVAQKADEYVFSPIIARPLGAAFLLTDPTSPLYKRDEFEKGFQLTDVVDAYNRTEEVSLGIASTKSLINPLRTYQTRILGLGGVDLEGIDLWNNEDVQKNFTDNVTGKWITGTNDFLYKNVAIQGAFSGLGIAARTGAVKAGLTTKIRVGDIEAMPKFEQAANDHILWLKTNGAQGQRTVLGQDIQDLAASDNIIDIVRIAEKHSLNPRLPNLIKETKDPEFVRDLILADKGYEPAAIRLMNAGNADDLWYISNGTAQVQNDFMLTGSIPVYSSAQRTRWTQAFDDAIKKDPKKKSIYDAFMKQEKNPETGLLELTPTFFGRNYKPMEPVIGQAGYAAARSKAGKIKTAIVERDFSKLGGVSQTVLGSKVIGGPATVLMRTFGTFMPKGLVTNSGLRPMNGVEELISVFDDIPLFRRGDKVITTHTMEQMTVSDYRRQLIDRFVSAKNDSERAAIIDAANKEITRTISYTRGYYDNAVIDGFVDDLMQNVYSVHGALREHGSSIDPSGVRIKVNAETQRKLIDSMPMLPFGKIDTHIARASRRQKNIVTGGVQTAVGTTADAIAAVFNTGNKLFSIAQLYRFSYIPKNSVFEPMLAATLDAGMDFIRPMATTASAQILRNTVNFVRRNIQKSSTLLPSAKREIQKEVDAIAQQYNIAINNRDTLFAEYQKFFGDTPGVSPRTKADWADDVRADLRAAESEVAILEAKLNKYTMDYGKNTKVDVPTVYSLKARIETLKKYGAAQYGSEIRAAEITLARATQNINTMAPQLAPLEAQIASAYDEIGIILDKLKPKLKEQADLFSVADDLYARKPLMPDEVTIRLYDGTTMTIPSFTNPKYLGEGYFSEISSNATRTLELLGNKATVGRVNLIMRSSARTTTSPADPGYFSELAYVANNHMRGDILVDQILQGATREQLLAGWAKTQQARSYANTRGRDYDDVAAMIDESIAYVNKYLPTQEARNIVASGKVTENQLRGALADKIDQMAPIEPLDINYVAPTTLSANFAQNFDALLSAAWKGLLKTENLIREVWATPKHARLVEEKLNILKAQGQEINLATAMSVRQAAAAELVDGITKTFYTIPRQHRALYLARYGFVFPNAAASGIYRYTGFAARKPKRVAGFLNAYYGLYNSFGIDKYGNPVENPMDAEYIMVPGTKDLGLNKGKGIMLSTRATNYLANLPGPNWMVPISVGQILKDKPNSDEQLREFVNNTVGKIPGYSYEELFPYGVETNLGTQVAKTFTPAWYRSWRTQWSESKTDNAWMATWNSESQRQWILYEMQLGPMPTEKSILKGAKDIYKRKAFNQFWSIFGTAQMIESVPTRVFTDYYSLLVDKYRAQGLPEEEAQDKAEADFQAQIRVSGGDKFPMDRMFASYKQRNLYVTPSIESFNRIWKDYEGLSKKLELIDPSVVGLLTADLPKGYNPQVNKFLNDPNSLLPGGTALNERMLTPKQVENELELSRFWKAYIDQRKAYDDAAIKYIGEGASYRDVPEYVEGLKQYVKQLSQASEIFKNDWNKNANKGDRAWTWSQGLYVITKPNPDGSPNKFMKEFGDTQFWVHAQALVKARDSYAKADQDAPTGSKGKIKEQWIAALDKSLPYWDPVLQRIISRYFISDNLRENN